MKRRSRLKLVPLVVLALCLLLGGAVAAATDIPLGTKTTQACAVPYTVYRKEYVPASIATWTRARTTVKGKPKKSDVLKTSNGSANGLLADMTNLVRDAFDIEAYDGTTVAAAVALEKRAKNGGLRRVDKIEVFSDETWKVRTGKAIKHIKTRLQSGARAIARALGLAVDDVASRGFVDGKERTLAKDNGTRQAGKAGHGLIPQGTVDALAGVTDDVDDADLLGVPEIELCSGEADGELVYGAIKATMNGETIAVVRVSDTDFVLDYQVIWDAEMAADDMSRVNVSHDRIAFATADVVLFPRTGDKATAARRCLAACHGLTSSDYATELHGVDAGKLMRRYKVCNVDFVTHDIYHSFNVDISRKAKAALAVYHIASLPRSLSTVATRKWASTLERPDSSSVMEICKPYINSYVKANGPPANVPFKDLEVERKQWRDVDKLDESGHRDRPADRQRSGPTASWKGFLPESSDNEPNHALFLLPSATAGPPVAWRLSRDRERVIAHMGPYDLLATKAVVVVGDATSTPDIPNRAKVARFDPVALASSKARAADKAVAKFEAKMAARVSTRGRLPTNPADKVAHAKLLVKHAPAVTPEIDSIVDFLDKLVNIGGAGKRCSPIIMSTTIASAQAIMSSVSETDAAAFAAAAAERQAVVFAMRAGLNELVLDLIGKVALLKRAGTSAADFAACDNFMARPRSFQRLSGRSPTTTT